MHLVLAIIVLVLSLMENCTGSDIVVDNGDIVITNGIITCNGDTCPKGTFKCVLKKESINNNQNLKKTATCLSATGNITAQFNDPGKNPNDGQHIQTYASATLNGTVISCSNCTNSGEANDDLYTQLTNTANVLNLTKDRVTHLLEGIFANHFPFNVGQDMTHRLLDQMDEQFIF